MPWHSVGGHGLDVLCHIDLDSAVLVLVVLPAAEGSLLLLRVLDLAKVHFGSKLLYDRLALGPRRP